MNLRERLSRIAAATRSLFKPRVRTTTRVNINLLEVDSFLNRCLCRFR